MPTVREFLSDHYLTRNPNIDMATVPITEIEMATGLTLTRADLEQAVLELRGNHRDAAVLQTNFYLVVRGPDEFSSETYIWITPKPPDAPITIPPDRCWIIRSPDGDATRQIDDGLLVFTKSGYAIGFMAAQGFGDFNVETWEWQDLVKGSKRDTAVIDYVEGRTPNIIKLR